MFWGLFYYELKYLSAIKHSVKVVKSAKLPHARRPSISVNDNNIEKVKETVLKNRCVGIREIAKDLNISYGSTQHILCSVEFAKEMLHNVAENFYIQQRHHYWWRNVGL